MKNKNDKNQHKDASKVTAISTKKSTVKQSTTKSADTELRSPAKVLQLQKPVKGASPLLKNPLPLTPKEKTVMEFICEFYGDNGYSPSYQEIKDHFGFASYNSIQNYLKQLARKGYIRLEAHQKRAIQVLHSPNQFSTTEPPAAGLLQKSAEALSVPLLGKTAAGLPLERIYHEEAVTVPVHLVKRPESTFALLVEGQSMVDEGIHDGDTIIVERVNTAKDGDLVVVTIDNEATTKRIFYHPKNDMDRRIELRPSNRELDSMWYSPFSVSLQGKVVGLIRQY